MRPSERPLIRGWRELGSAERDPGFSSLVAELTERGLRGAAFSGLAALLLYFLASFLSGRAFSMAWTGQRSVVPWDKLLIACALISLYLLSRRELGRRFGREITCFVALLAGLASLADDWMNQDVTFSSAWFVLFLFVAIGSMPLRPVQVVALCLVMLSGFVIPVSMTPEAVSAGSLRAQSIFLSAVMLMACVVSVSLYRMRFRLYRVAARNRELADEIARKADRIEQVEALKTRFFTGITHDLRTPVSLIVGPVNDVLGLTADELPGSARKHLEIARRNAIHLKDLADDLLDLAHIDSGHLALRTRPHDLAAACGRWVADLQPLAERTAVRLTFEHAPAGKPLVCEMDPDRLRQVVVNLVSNAVRFTQPGGEVLVTARTVEDAVIAVEVQDDGPGIPPEEIDSLFDRFTRSPSGSPRSGFGLGLAIAREFVLLHGGQIRVVSREGPGATFQLELPGTASSPHPLPARHSLELDGHPLDREDLETDLAGLFEYPQNADVDAFTAVDRESGSPGDDVQPEHPLAGHASRLPLVVVADDNPDMRLYLRLHLAGQYRIAEAVTGEQALEIVRARNPDLVLSDVMMPGLDGISLCRAIRADERIASTPVVLLTARGDHRTQIDGLSAGADDFLVKPFDAEALMARVENLIELRRLLRTGAPFASVAVGPSAVNVPSTVSAFVERVRDIVESNLANTNFGVDWLADEVALSPRQLQRRLRDATRLSAAGFIRMMRLARAAQLLAAGASNVSETAYAVGFRDTDHFAHLFRQAFGVSPSDYARDRKS